MSLENFASYDYDYDYSGETSEDLETEIVTSQFSRTMKKAQTFKSLSLMDEPAYEKTLEEHLQTINPKVSADSKVPYISFFTDFDFNLEQFSTSNNVYIPPICSSIESINIDVAHISQYPHTHSSSTECISPYLAWSLPSDASSKFEFPTILHSIYKTHYQDISHTLRFYHMVSPTKDNFKTLATQRKEFPLQRILFHYVGYGYPLPTNNSISCYDAQQFQTVPYPISQLVSQIRSPSFFIFDCDNAGTLIPSIIKETNELDTSKVDLVDDLIILCATDANEKLPADPRLPRDFLTSCLLTPIETSILCHILKYYRTSFPSIRFPLDCLNTALLGNNELKLTLQLILESISADYLPTNLFIKLFRTDKVISVLFHNFILAQYLLLSYNISPISYPKIPNMSIHPLWFNWEASLDTWITSNFVILPTRKLSYFPTDVNIYENLIKNKTLIKPSMLLILLQMPFYKQTENDNLFKLISDYILSSKENQKKVSSIIPFNQYFQKLFEPIKDINEYNSLCIIILSVIEYNKDIMYQIKKDFDITKIYNYIFDKNLNEKTKTLITCIITCFIIYNKNLRQLNYSDIFFNNIREILSTNNISNVRLQWTLMFICKTFEINSYEIEESFFYETSIHFQIASLIYHNSHFVRSIALNCLSCFIQINDDDLNLLILMVSIPIFTDISYLVRFELLKLICKFLCIYEDKPYVSIHNIQKLSTFNDLLNNWLSFHYDYNQRNDFITFIKLIDNFITQKTDGLSLIFNNAFNMLDYFIYDPHPYVSSYAKNAKQHFQKILLQQQSNTNTNNNNNTQKHVQFHASPPSIIKKTLPFNNLQWSNSTNTFGLLLTNSNNNIVNNEYFKNNNNELFETLQHRTIKNEGIEPINNNINVNKTQSKQYGNILINSVELQQKFTYKFESNVKHIAFSQTNVDTVISLEDNTIIYLKEDNELSNDNKIKVNNGKISDLQILNYNNDNFIISTTNKGCLNIWKPENKYFSSMFRVDSNFICDSIEQYLTILKDSSKIATARGNNSINLWDLETQKILGNWIASDHDIISSLIFHPNNNNQIFCGYSTGDLIGIDIRVPSTEKNNFIFMNKNLKENIIKLGINRNGGEFLYIATSSGNCSLLNTKDNTFNNVKIKQQIVGFDIHELVPLCAVARKKENLAIMGLKGQMFFQSKSIGCDSVFKFHPVLPMISIGNNGGDLVSYNVVSKSKDCNE